MKCHWLEAESSSHKVGGSQVEMIEEKEDAMKRGKAKLAVIGMKSIGTRFNVLMIIQIPLQQSTPTSSSSSSDDCASSPCYWPSSPAYCTSSPCYWPSSPAYSTTLPCHSPKSPLYSPALPSYQAASPAYSPTWPSYSSICDEGDNETKEEDDAYCNPRLKKRKIGTSSAARVSKGSFHDSWNGLSVKELKRHQNEHITATIVMYYTCSGGAPSTADVKSAIDDLEGLY